MSSSWTEQDESSDGGGFAPLGSAGYASELKGKFLNLDELQF